ncbi:MAG: polysaccharide biosynthesis tyrosine autokinase [Enterobacteriaceae bacterium]|jgi:tyrosine-protein kinase Etk/Wzc|nr:polysaccharide biosynthesis tyrosine autokinase [Enterobacteriaceae bacterium]
MVSKYENPPNDLPKNDGDEIDLSKMIGIIVDHKWIIAIITVLFTVISIFYCLIATPIYRADVLIQIEKSVSNNILTNLPDILSDGKPQSASEIELLKSRMVIGKTVDDLKLNIETSEKYFPVIGKLIANLQGKPEGKIAVSKFDIPNSMYDESFILTVLADNKYQITADGIQLDGKVGEIHNQDKFSVLISDIDAPEGTKFRLRKLSQITAINNLLENFSVSDTTKDGGMLRLQLTGQDKNEICNIIDNISNNYLQQNVERKSEEAAKSLEFLNEQLPLVKHQLEESEIKLNKFRQTHESIDLTLEAKSALESSVSVTSQLNEVTFKEAEVSKLYTKAHPVYRSLIEKKKTLQKESERLNQQITGLPKTQQEILRLTRDVQSGQEIYMLLLNKQQALNISKASTVGNVRIVDTAAVQPNKIKPKSLLIISAAFIFGLFSSISLVLIREYFTIFINESAQLESLGLDVYANIPLEVSKKSKSQTKDQRLLAIREPTDLSIEAMRSLRTSLYFSLLNAENKIVMITGATPEVGKSFVSSNLAAVFAQSGKKVLLIDADMRRGSLHTLFNLTPEIGLSNILSNQTQFVDCLNKTSVEGLDFISRGQAPLNPSELLMGNKISELLSWANDIYDLVIVDTPPILATTDPAIIGKYSGINIIIARFEKSSVSEIEAALKRFKQNGVQMNGIVLNAVERRASTRYSNGHYEYYSYQTK